MSGPPRELLESASRGDDQAVDELLARYLPGLKAFIRLRSGPLIRARETADDLAQSVCREVLQNIERFQHGSEAGFKHWLYTTAMRRIQNKHDFWKAQKRDAARDVPIDARRSKSDPGALLDAYHTFSTPSRNLMAREELERIEESFDKLSDTDREIITLSRIVGLSHAEIAEKLGKSEGAARTQLHRALIRLAEFLGD